MKLFLLFLALFSCIDAQYAGFSASDDWLVTSANSSPSSNFCSLAPSSVSVVDITSSPRPYQLLTISNSLLHRQFGIIPAADAVKQKQKQNNTQDVAFCTFEFTRRLPNSNFQFVRALAPEGNVTLNQTDNYDIGGCAGYPHGHSEFLDVDSYLSSLYASPLSFTYLSHSVSAPVAPFPYTPGYRGSPVNVQWPPSGVHLTVNMKSPTDAEFSKKYGGLTVSLHYELYDCAPVLRKWIEFQYTSDSDSDNDDIDAAVEISRLNMEIMRSPNGAPERLSVLRDYSNNPTPNDDQIAPDSGFPGRNSRLWFLDDDYDECCDRELHVTYTMYTLLIAGYGEDKVYGGSTGPGALLVKGTVGSPSSSFTSLSLRLVLHDSVDDERHGLTLRRVQALLAPHLQQNPMHMMITDVSTTEVFTNVINQAAEVGLEMLIVGFGANGYCGLCDGQLLNATWVSWFAGQVSLAKSKGIEISAYTLMQHNGWGEDTPASEQVLDRDGNRAGVACFATDYHAKYREDVLDFIRKVGMGGLETDGQYENVACTDSVNDHHHNGVSGSWHSQVVASLEFNMALKSINGGPGPGIYQTGADAYYFSGANRWNHADTDAGFNLPSFWEKTTIGRQYSYDSSFTRLPSSGTYQLNDLLGDATSACGMDGRVVCVDYALGSFVGIGSWPAIRRSSIYDAAADDAKLVRNTFAQWHAFWAKHRQILIGDLIHLQPPSARSMDIHLHLLNLYSLSPASASPASLPSNTSFGLLCIVNPTSSVNALSQSGRHHHHRRGGGDSSLAVAVPLYFSGLAPGDRVVVSMVDASEVPKGGDMHVGPGVEHTLGAEGAAVFDVVIDVIVQPRSYAIFLFSTP